jgi:hypothetical protein
MRRTSAFLVAATLLALAGCGGSDAPAGTISEDDLPDGVSVSKVTHDVQANQVQCQDVNDAEDNAVVSASDTYNTDDEAAVSYRLKGSGKEVLASSVWPVPDPGAAVEKVSAGLEACLQADPGVYARFDVPGYPSAIGYTAREGSPTPVYTRRILVPRKDRVVILSISRRGDDSFSVSPDDLLARAVAVAAHAPR